jgi:hypothetical protein
MPTFTVPHADSLENTVAELIKRFEWIMAKLDSKNVKRLDTNETVIKSADGTTEIVGPVLVMKDNSGQTRLMQGLDKATSTFLFQLLNAAGDITVNVDSNGDLIVERGTFKGSITVGTGNNVLKADNVNGLWVGHADFVSAPFKVTLAGNVTINDGTFKGTVEIGTTYKTKILEDNGSGMYALFDNTDTLVGYLKYNGSYVELSSVNGKQIQLISDEDIFLVANKNISIGGEDISLIPSVGYTAKYYDGSPDVEIATKGWVNSQGYITGVSGANGVFTTADGKTVTVSDGLITSIT